LTSESVTTDPTEWRCAESTVKPSLYFQFTGKIQGKYQNKTVDLYQPANKSLLLLSFHSVSQCSSKINRELSVK